MTVCMVQDKIECLDYQVAFPPFIFHYLKQRHDEERVDVSIGGVIDRALSMRV